MLLQVPDVLGPGQLAECRELLAGAPWVDGSVTAGFQSRQVKHNQQVAEGADEAQRLGDIVRGGLGDNPLFLSAALPARVFPPLFNRYAPGEGFGTHVDNAIRQVPGTSVRVRTDLSATLFLSDPAEYDGGELIIEDTFGSRSVKLPAGHLVLYPATSLHRVQPVGRGVRLASFFWIQSLVNDDVRRTLLFDLDMAIVSLRTRLGDDPNVVSLTGVYHNLVRQWAQP